MLGLCFSSNLDWGSSMVSITKTASQKIGGLIHLIKLLSLEDALYVYKSTIQICQEYCCHVCGGALSCYLNVIDHLQKQVVGLLAQHWLSLFDPWLIVKMWPAQVFYIGIALVGAHLYWLNWIHIFILVGGLFVILIDCMINLSPLIEVIRILISATSFLAQLDYGILCLWNAFP